MTAVTEVGYRGPEVCRMAGITYRQLDHWARVGMVPPSLAPAHGSGTQRRYSLEDVACLRVVGQLREGARILAVDSPACRQVVDVVRRRFAELGPDSFILLSATDVRYTNDPLDLAALAFATEAVVVVPLWPILRELVAPT